MTFLVLYYCPPLPLDPRAFPPINLSPLSPMALQERKLPFGKIEPNSAKYFYSCALGGIIGRSYLPRLRSTLANIVIAF